jgi:hypothetical protein
VSDPLEIFAAVAGVIVGLPTLVLVVRVAMFFGELRTTVKSLQKTADRYTRATELRIIAVVEDLANFETRLTLIEAGVVMPRIPRKLRALEPIELEEDPRRE